MPQLTPQVSEVLEKALALSTHERGLIIDRLVESLDDEPARRRSRGGLVRRDQAPR
jgi:hypothetical protein